MTYTKWDEYLIHQTGEPIDRMAGPEKECFEYLYLYAHPMGEGPIVMAGLNVHPNANIMAGYGQVLIDNVQYNFRASRHLHHDRADMVIGPLSFEVIEPLRRWGFRLRENSMVPITFDLEFVGKAPVYATKEVHGPPDRGSTVPTQWRTIFQPGRFIGSLTVEGKRYDATGYFGSRDHSWGIRGINLGLVLENFVSAQFRHHSIFIWYQEDEHCNPIHTEGAIIWDEGKIAPIVKVEQKMTLEAGTRELSFAEVDITDSEGKRSKLTASKRLSRGMYARGQWSGEGFYQDFGPYHEEGERWDLNEQDTLLMLGKWLREAPCQFEHDGEVGYGFYEYAVSKKHKGYGPSL